MYDYSSIQESTEGLGALVGGGIFGVVLTVAAVVFFLAMNWMIFAKAGEAGWKSLIPFYNSYILYKIAWGKGWMFLLTLIPFVGFVFPIICYFKLARAFGHSFWYGLGLNLLPIVFLPMLAFGKSQYVGPAV